MKFKGIKILFLMFIIFLSGLTLTSCFEEILEETEGFVISFDNQGHGEKPEDIKDVYKIPTNLPKLTEDGYIFGGWYYDEECTIIVVASMLILSDVTLYAKWSQEPEPEKYDIYFNINGHGNSVKSITGVETIPDNLPVSTEEGYTFSGWYYEIECINEAKTGDVLSSNVTLYAKWIKNKEIYTVVFNTLEGTNIDNISVEEESLIEKPVDPEKEGYVFAGWYKDSNYNTIWDFDNDKVTSNIELYAKWTIKQVTVYFDTLGGNLIEEVILNYDSLVSKPVDPVNDGYTFGGWYKDPIYTTEWVFTTDKVSSNTILYAKWIPNANVEEDKYIISFNTCGVGDIPDYISNVTQIPESLPILEESGYTFGGWYYDVDCRMPAVPLETIYQNTTLYAKWTRLTYLVTFDVQGIGTKPTSIQVYELPELPILEVDGYTFDGWYYDVEGNNIAEIGDSVSTNTTLYAKWTEKPVESTFEVHFLELGNGYAGDCVFIKAGDVDILIDAGSRKSSSSTLIDYIDDYCTDGILEYVIVTHAHQDHIAAFVDNSSTEPGIFSYYDVEVIIDFPKWNTTSQISKDYFAARDAEVAAGAEHYTALECVRGTNGAQKVYNITDDISFEILEHKYYSQNGDENNYSVCTLFRHGEEYFLFTGDLELAGEQSLVQMNNLPQVKVYKGGHHGSSTSSNNCLLNVIKPEIVCICTCAGSDEYTKNTDNMFPTQETINRLAVYTDQIYITTVATYTIATSSGSEYLKRTGYESMNGNIRVISNSSGVTVNCSNNNIVLKNSEWFNTTITLNGETRKMRTWPSNGK